ncbi:hypothetical protein HDV06_004717 [Boothiomyces sp. JEL0866]|nr:hypothetical protein HDV06_004717 [Boothiomyces sp. JEL0866]
MSKSSLNLNLEHPKVVTSYLGKLPLQSIFQRVLGVGYVLFIPFCVFGPIYTPIAFTIYYLILNVFLILNNVRTTFGARSAYLGAKKHSQTNWAEKYCETTGASFPDDTRHDLPFDAVRHVIIIPQYKEDMGTMYDTLDVLASHSMALSNYKICLAMEESEAEAPTKAQKLIQKYQDQFYDITFTLHPSNRPGEIRGKSSNVAWAAREMIRQCGGPRIEEIITVMDADTCFAQDYFQALSYHYACGTPTERNLMMFCPTTVFDRNADKVPFVVRLADIIWSLGVMSNMYESSPIKIPCSAYSLPMTLAASVGSWDVGPQAMGEDFHMFLKCFFSTHGRLDVRTIYSPASQCNVQGNSWLGGVYDRYIQAKRHMWGCIDFGYVMRRTVFGILAPKYDAPNNIVQKVPTLSTTENEDVASLLAKIVPLYHRVLEAHVIMGQVFLMSVVSTLVIPAGNYLPTATPFWNYFTTTGVHPYVAFAVYVADWVRFVMAFFLIFTIYYYEKYYRWCGTDRWIHSLQEQLHPGTGFGVRPLGKRSKVMYNRSSINILDWTAIPFAGIFFLALPQFHCQTLQLFTDTLDYVVAGKPIAPPEEKEEEVETYPLVNSRSMASSIEDKSSRADSGFYEFDETHIPIDPNARFSPSMWKEAAGSSTLNQTHNII